MCLIKTSKLRKRRKIKQANITFPHIGRRYDTGMKYIWSGTGLLTNEVGNPRLKGVLLW